MKLHEDPSRIASKRRQQAKSTRRTFQEALTCERSEIDNKQTLGDLTTPGDLETAEGVPECFSTPKEQINNKLNYCELMRMCW